MQLLGLPLDFDVEHLFLLFGVEIASYLVGAIPFGYLVALWAAGIDVRKHGSGNIGATNVGRLLGFRFFVVVFLLDFLKGALPVAACYAIQAPLLRRGPEAVVGWYLPEAAGIAAILGHMFPIYLNFKGGKGVATSVGVLLLLVPKAAAIGLAAFVVLFVATRMVSVGSIAFAIAFAASHFLLEADAWSGPRKATSAFVVAAAALVLIRHRTNVGRILRGTEPRVGRPKPSAESSPPA